ncbi:Hypothetical protein A7982_11760 [Minicystis rosea]|nr:Hypothetical protein A7982_11760 [Minicystis rosea]
MARLPRGAREPRGRSPPRRGRRDNPSRDLRERALARRSSIHEHGCGTVARSFVCG